MNERINLSYIKQMLFLANQPYYDRKHDIELLEGKKDLYEETLYLLNLPFDQLWENRLSLNILINTLYRNSSIDVKILSLVNVLLNSDNSLLGYKKDLEKFKGYLVYFNDEYNLICKQIEENKKYVKENGERVKIFNSIISEIKYKYFISEDQITELEQYLTEQKTNSVDVIKILEYIRMHNNEVAINKKLCKKDYKYNIINMLDQGYEYIVDDTLDYDNKLPSELKLQIANLELYRSVDESIDEFLENLVKVYDDKNLLQLILIGLLNYLQYKVSETVELSKEFYKDKQTRYEIMEEYNKLIPLYDEIRSFYDLQLANEEDISDEFKESNVLIYAHNGLEPYFLNDLKDISNEYLSRVMKLIDNFKTGEITKKQIGGFVDICPDCRKLKQDQVRIVIKPVKENIWCVLGVGEKKEQRGSKMYQRLGTRMVPKDIEEALKQTSKFEEEINEYVKTNSRKGNR